MPSKHRSARSRGGTGVVFVLALALASLLIAGGAYFVLQRGAPPEDPPSQDPETLAYLRSLEIRPFVMRDQDDGEVSNSILRGQYTILAFTFTNCTTACPVMSSHLLMAHHDAEDLPLQIVSMSVDPEHDTPEALAAYAQKLSIDTRRWTLLTGKPGEVAGIVREDLGFALHDDPTLMIELGDGKSMVNIVHPSRLLLIDPQGTFIGLYPGLEAQGIADLLADVRAMHGNP